MQVCFVVENVEAAAARCESSFGWGPFEHFTAEIPDGRYRDWTGRKVTEVALGWAGSVQVELIRVHEGHDSIEAYQSRYGIGFQHLGVSCSSRDEGIALLESIGGHADDLLEYESVRIAFVDLPTGPAMFELLEDVTPPGRKDLSPKMMAGSSPRLPLDRATIVTRDLDRDLAFFGSALGWVAPVAESATLRASGSETRMRRYLGKAGSLMLELIEPPPGTDNPYARHLERRDHGLVHASGILARGEPPDAPCSAGSWLEVGEDFRLYDWIGGPASLQIRSGGT